MSGRRGAALGALLGLLMQGGRYVLSLPEGARLDYAGLAGFAASGALLGALAGAILAALIRFRRR